MYSAAEGRRQKAEDRRWISGGMRLVIRGFWAVDRDDFSLLL